MVAVTSADPFIIKNFLTWLKRYFRVPANRIRLRLHLWPSSEIKEAQKYWAEQLNLSLKNFTKPFIKKESGRNRKYKYGICRAGIYSKDILSKIMREIKKEFYK